MTLAVAGETRWLQLQWDENVLQGPLIVLKGLSGVDGILGMDVLKPLRVKMLAHESTAEPGGNRDTAPRILYLPQNIDLPPNSRRQILLHHDVLSNITVLSYHEASPRAKGSTHCIGWRLISLRHCQSHCGVSTIAAMVGDCSVDPGSLRTRQQTSRAQRSFRYSYRSDAISTCDLRNL
ncbi:hypothetical protein GWK47_043515 [Chionoecetes opilio]|uniref:Uncharacterized protein n=1 Tax=Chionoecetes opilio TaxID=41210 RepID=A0A8J5CZK3_CHIOP|nr:hypothetical protein GWK47_043515 [Chionoecetes opilio]